MTGFLVITLQPNHSVLEKLLWLSNCQEFKSTSHPFLLCVYVSSLRSPYADFGGLLCPLFEAVFPELDILSLTITQFISRSPKSSPVASSIINSSSSREQARAGAERAERLPPMELCGASQVQHSTGVEGHTCNPST